MKCVNCTKEITLKMKYCPYCGQSQKKQCLHCGTSCESDYKFCYECGTSLIDDQDNQLFQVDTSPNIPVTKHLPYENNIEDIRKHATVLFADIKGSTSLVEGMDPEEAKNILLPIVDAMRDGITSYGGTIIKTAGDGIVAVFGAPQAFEDHALRACLAALSMQENVAKTNVDIKIRVGLHSGEVYLEVIGDENHREYDVAGQTVNLAARMEQTAKPGTVQITRSTYSLVEKNVQVDSIGAIEVKGFSHPIDVFELQAASKKNKLLKDIKDRPTFLPFMGRKKELELLIQLAERAKSGNGSAVGLIADAGQGKSRLLYEFLHNESVGNTVDVLMTGGLSHTKNTPYYPIKQALQNWMGINSKESSENIITKLKPYTTLLSTPHALDALSVLLGGFPVDKEWDKLEQALKRKYQLDAIISLLITASTRKPLIMIIEDSHWIDSETEALVDVLITGLDQSHLLLILTQRTEYLDRWVNRPGYTQIKLGPLSQHDEKDALNKLLGDHPTLVDIKKQLAKNCAGNPFFLEEMIKSLIRDKILIGTVGYFQLSEKALAGTIQLPESIFAVLQAQLDSLPIPERNILRMASVIGERFSYLLLTKIMDGENSEVIQKVLQDLTENQYIYETRIFPQPESAFKHALIHEVTYNGLLKSMRRSMHNKILSVLESMPPESEDVQLFAYHAYQGESWEKAFHYYQKAARECFFNLSANKSAAELYEKALIAASHLQNRNNIMRECLRIHMSLIIIYRRLCWLKDEGRHIKETGELLLLPENKDMHVLKTLFYTSMGSYYLSLGETHKSLHWYDESYNESLLCEDKMMKAVCESSCAFIYLFTGDYATLYKKADNALQIFPSLGFRHELFPLPMGHFSNWIKSWAHAYTGDYDPKENYEKQVNYLSSSTDIYQCTLDSTYVSMAIGWLCFYQKEYDKAIEHLLRSLKFATELEILQYIPSISAALGISYLKINQKEQGELYTELALQKFNSVDSYMSKSLSLDLITEALLLIGNYFNARTFCDKAILIANQCELAGIKTTLLRLDAEIDLHFSIPDYKAIETKLQESIEMGSILGMVSNTGHCQAVLAVMYQQIGNVEAGKQAEQLAKKCYDKLNINFKIAT